MATLFNTKIKDTYQSLLKLEDNTILTTTSKNITDGLGNASPLYLSTTQVRIGSNSGSAMYWDNVNNRLGVGTNAPNTNLEVYSGAGGYISHNANSGYNGFSGFRCNVLGGVRGYMELNPNTGEFKVGADGSGYFLTLGAAGVERMRVTPTGTIVKGSGSTSATTSLLVQNSSGSAALIVRDDGYVIGNSRVYSTGNMYMDGNTGLLFSAWGQLQLQGASYVQINNDTLRTGSQNFNFLNLSFSPNGNTNSNLRLAGNGSSFTNAGAGGTSVGNVLEIPIGIATSIGNVTLNHININGVVNTTAGTTLQRGFYYNPTLTSTTGFTHRAIETTTGDVLFGTTSGNVGIGITNPITNLQVRGTILSGSGSGDTFSSMGSAIGNYGGVGSNYYTIGNTYYRTYTDSVSQLYFNAGGFQFRNAVGGSANSSITFNTQMEVGVGAYGYLTLGTNVSGPISGAKLGIRGDGSTSATTSLLVQNSGGTQSLKVTDNGFVNVGDYASNFGGLAVPFDGVSFGTKPFIVTQRDGVALLSMISNTILEISAPSLRVQPIIQFQNTNSGLRGPDAQNISQSSIVLSSGVNAYNGTSQNDACNLVYIQNRGSSLQAAGSINWIKMDGSVNELGGGGSKWCTGIYYNPTFTGGTLLANSHYCYHATSGQMMVNTTSPQASAQLQVDSTTRGFLPPRVTTIQKNAIATPAEGLMVYDTDLKRPCFFNGTSWITL